MPKSLRYVFDEIHNCNMCGAGSENFIILGKRLNKSQGYNPHKKHGISTTVFKCKRCNLIFSNPLPIPLDIQDHYGTTPETYWKEDYFRVSEEYFSYEISWFKKLVDYKTHMKSLDIGAGIGKQMVALDRAGFDVYGLEPGQYFHNLAVEKMKIPESKLKLSTIEEAKYEKDYFDFISFGAVLEHLYNPSSSIERALQWLKPGGLMHIEVPNSGWLISKLLNAYYKARSMDYVTNISPMHIPYHLYEFSLQSFVENGRKSGYKICDHKYYICETTLPKFLDPLLKPLMRKTDMGMQLCVWLKKL